MPCHAMQRMSMHTPRMYKAGSWHLLNGTYNSLPMKRRVSPHPLSASSYEDLFRDRRARPVSQFEARFLSGVCGSTWRDWKISWQVIRESARTQNELSCTTKMYLSAWSQRSKTAEFPDMIFRGSLRRNLRCIHCFSRCVYCGNKAAKKTLFAPTNFKTCWSRCYTNQLHWFLHKLRKKCAPVFTQALQKLVFTPTTPCTQTSFCTI